MVEIIEFRNTVVELKSHIEELVNENTTLKQTVAKSQKFIEELRIQLYSTNTQMQPSTGEFEQDAISPLTFPEYRKVTTTVPPLKLNGIKHRGAWFNPSHEPCDRENLYISNNRENHHITNNTYS